MDALLLLMLVLATLSVIGSLVLWACLLMAAQSDAAIADVSDGN